MKCVVIDVTKCIGCYNCQITCKDEHVGNDWMPYSKPQTEGQFWVKVDEYERGTLPKVRVDWIPKLCMHCEDAPCAAACTENAIYARSDGIMIIDPDKCKGSRKCIEACPYGVIYFNEELKISQKCTMCAHLLDEGWEEPRCVRACPTDALRYGEYEDMQELIRKSEVHPTDKGKAEPKVRVFYLGLPKGFIIGEVYSPGEDKCIEGAKITARDITTGELATAKTNNYGDFCLEKLKDAFYSLVIEKEGYYSKELYKISSGKGVNLGAIKLKKKI
jgi:tetrathionate reductase subunit B